MKKIYLLLLLAVGARFVSQGQCDNFTVYIDSIVVKPCAKIPDPDSTGGGGTCGCGNTLWAVVTGGTPPYTYHWSPITNAPNNTDTLFKACYVVYTVVVTDANGCTVNDSLKVVIPDTTAAAGIKNYRNDEELKIFPVPASDQLTIQIPEYFKDANYFEMYDLTGKKVFVQKINPGSFLFTTNVATLPEGNYMLRIIGISGQKIKRFSVTK